MGMKFLENRRESRGILTPWGVSPSNFASQSRLRLLFRGIVDIHFCCEAAYCGIDENVLDSSRILVCCSSCSILPWARFQI